VIPSPTTTLAGTWTPEPTATSKVTLSESLVIPVCTGQGDALTNLENLAMTGTLWYKQLYPLNEIYRFDTEKRVSELFPRESKDAPQTHVLGFSPDGQWMAYLAYDIDTSVFTNTMNITLLSSTGENFVAAMDLRVFANELEDGYWDVAGTNLSYWVNDHLIYAQLFLENDGPPTSNALLPVLFDPFTREWQLEAIFLSPGRDKYDELALSPDMSRALYNVVLGEGMVLYNVGEKQEIWRDEEFRSVWPETLIRWSPESAFAAYGDNFPSTLQRVGVYLVSRDADGGRKQIFDGSFGYRGTFFYWSPNGRYLAIMTENYADEGNTFELFVYDVAEDHYVVRCPVKIDPWRFYVVWAPDNTQIVYGNSPPITPEENRTMQLFDLPSGQTYDLGIAEAYPIGWTSDEAGWAVKP
jgi:hypothetical protein